MSSNGVIYYLDYVKNKRVRAAAKHSEKIITLVEVAQCGPSLPCFTSNTTNQLRKRFLLEKPEQKLIGMTSSIMTNHDS